MRSYIHPTGDWTSGDSVLHLPCMCRLYFAFTSKIENNVSYWCKYNTMIKLKLQSSTFCLQCLHHCRYLPNELRGGMMSFSLSLANAIFVFLLQVSIWSPLLSEPTFLCKCSHNAEIISFVCRAPTNDTLQIQPSWVLRPMACSELGVAFICWGGGESTLGRTPVVCRSLRHLRLQYKLNSGAIL
jgi:hypothetical protein